MVLCFRTGEEGAEDEENPSPDNAPPEEFINLSIHWPYIVLLLKVMKN